jgi:hypothetical protein
MGRQLHRVPLDFGWPVGKVWKGYLNPQRTDPPKGEGYQLWETVSEGSPCSPVFKSPEELAHWLTHSPDYRGKVVDAGTTYEQWLRFILGPGWAPSFIIGPNGLQTGVQACETKL